MGLLPGMRYSAAATRACEIPFMCEHCGHADRAQVVALGEGFAQSALFLDNEGAAARARESAQEYLQEDAKRAASLARCPQCGRRSRVAQRRLRWSLAIRCLLGVAAALLVSWVYERVWSTRNWNDAPLNSALLLVLFLVQAPIFAAMLCYLPWRSRRGAEKRVSFESAADALRRAVDSERKDGGLIEWLEKKLTS